MKERITFATLVGLVAYAAIATDLYLPDGRLNTELWDEQRLTTWFDVFLPSLRLDEPFVYEMLTDSAVFWIKEYGLDGFRHDFVFVGCEGRRAKQEQNQNQEYERAGRSQHRQILD